MTTLRRLPISLTTLACALWVTAPLVAGCAARTDGSAKLSESIQTAAHHALRVTLAPPVCPSGSFVVFVSSSEGEDSPGRVEQGLPVATLGYAKRVIDAAEDAGTPEDTRYCVLLRGGEVFRPVEYFRMHFEGGQEWGEQAATEASACVAGRARYRNRNRVAFFWSYNKPLTLATYGNGIATIEGSEETELRTDACCDVCRAAGHVCASTHCTPQRTNRMQLAVVITGERNEQGQGVLADRQETLIQGIRFHRWQMGALYLFRTRNVHLRANEFADIGTLYAPDDSFILEEPEQAIPGESPIGGWRLYAGGAVSIVRSTDVTVGATADDDDPVPSGNMLINLHNAEDADHSTVDKLHAFYVIASSRVTIRANRILRASGPPVAIRNASRHVLVADNVFEEAAPPQCVTHAFSGLPGYVQQGFIRIPCSPTDWNRGECPNDVQILRNRFRWPFCAAMRLRGESVSACGGLSAVMYSGEMFARLTTCTDCRIAFEGNEITANYGSDELGDAPLAECRAAIRAQ